MQRRIGKQRKWEREWKIFRCSCSAGNRVEIDRRVKKLCRNEVRRTCTWDVSHIKLTCVAHVNEECHSKNLEWDNKSWTNETKKMVSPQEVPCSLQIWGGMAFSSPVFEVVMCYYWSLRVLTFEVIEVTNKKRSEREIKRKGGSGMWGGKRGLAGEGR